MSITLIVTGLLVAVSLPEFFGKSLRNRDNVVKGIRILGITILAIGLLKALF